MGCRVATLGGTLAPELFRRLERCYWQPAVMGIVGMKRLQVKRAPQQHARYFLICLIMRGYMCSPPSSVLGSVGKDDNASFRELRLSDSHIRSEQPIGCFARQTHVMLPSAFQSVCAPSKPREGCGAMRRETKVRRVNDCCHV